MIRWLAALVWPLGLVLYLCGSARADVGGEVPGPGLCDYPAIGGSGAEFGVYHYVCDFPTEINGAHHHCQYGGGMIQGNVGVSFMFVNASITTPIGVLEGVCYWACPDLSVSDPPNPPGAWKSYIRPAACKPVAPNPLAPPPPPPDDPPPVAAIPPYVPPGNNLDPTLAQPDNTAPPGR